MKKIFLVMAIFIFGFDAFGAGPAYRTQTATGRNTTEKTGTTGTARRSSGRSAITQVQKATPTRTRAAAPAPTTPSPDKKVATRAAKQNVINTGTKIAAAATNTAIDEVCWGKFSGCMDSFCMMDNANGGRCMCSDENETYDSILAEIQDLDNQSYQMATVGVERIEMGADADAVMKQTAAITKSIEDEAAAKAKSKRKSLDLSAWNVSDMDFDIDAEDIFGLGDDGVSLANKKGDALYRASAKLCNEQIPECKNQSTMMELMYKQRIRSDCTAYENSLRQQRTQSAQKLAAAQGAMREAALEQYRNANKYDLGQCVVAFKECMQTTGGCGNDFTGCVTYDTTLGAVTNKKSVKLKAIKGASTSVSIAAWTYDVLDAKKTLCMGVTQQCVNVRDQVWDSFLREAAPQIKAAELTAESDLRTSCITNITNCFQKACKDNIDPNNPDGSYDMCLTRPETLGDVCKVQIEPCEKISSNIMDYVHARLASMRVDSCTKDFKECLQSEDRCGEDYTQCVGLDTDTIVGLCPTDKLVGCQYKTTDENGELKSDKTVRQRLAEVAQGIFLNIDNNLLKACQTAVRNKMVEICGDTGECSAFYDDEIIGTDSLLSTKRNNDTVISGLMNFGLLTLEENNNTQNNETTYKISCKNYTNICDANGQPKSGLSSVASRILASVNTVTNKANQKIALLTTDQTIDRCINGRSSSWRYTKNQDHVETGNNQQKRFPHLLDSYKLMIFNSALDQAYLNYRTKYDKMVAEALETQSDEVKSLLCAAITYDTGSAKCKKYGQADENGNPKCTEYDAVGALSSTIAGLYDMENTGLQNDGMEYVISGANLEKRLQAISDTGTDYIQTDGHGNMLGRINMRSFYSPGTNTCTVITTTTMCKETRDIITEDTTTTNDTAFVMTPFGGGGGNTYTQFKAQEFHGIACSEFLPETTETTPIEM